MKAPDVTRTEAARVCMPTWRAFARAPFQCYRYEAQDVLCEADDVDLLSIEPGESFSWREQPLRRLMWHPPGRAAVRLNPGLKKARLDRNYDLFVAVCESWWDLLYINAVDGWQRKCRTSVLWLDELFVGMLRRYRHWLPSLKRFDHIVLGHLRSVEEVSRILGRQCHWAPPAVDVLRFAPPEDSCLRPIGVLSIGRRHEGIHAALKSYMPRRGDFYLYDTLQGVSMTVNNPREHREVYAEKLRRSRVLLVGPGMMGESEAAGEHVVGARFFEGAAAGAILAGERPRCDEFELLFDWADTVIELDPSGGDTEKILEGFFADPARVVQARRNNVAECARRHDWIHRWRQIYDIAGIPASQGMLKRERQLEELAGRFSSSVHFK
ncbi:MAG: glycosyltransferase [Bryobacteraceae bacterium]|nr:glycosyltransferase [Bryobacteraceae bacterium]